jgi:NlpC/P60 family putative phage cell wall peptidase
MKTLNERIVEEAKGWIGVPYQHRSWSKFGCDCTGLIIGIMKALGFGPDYQVRLYPLDWCLHDMADNHLLEEISKYTNRIPKAHIIPGDILLFKWGKCASHMGILIEDNIFIHTLIRQKVKKTPLINSTHKRHLVGAFRMDENKMRGVT